MLFKVILISNFGKGLTNGETLSTTTEEKTHQLFSYCSMTDSRMISNSGTVIENSISGIKTIHWNTSFSGRKGQAKY